MHACDVVSHGHSNCGEAELGRIRMKQEHILPVLLVVQYLQLQYAQPATCMVPTLQVPKFPIV